jgi:hypothetical protein
LYFGGLFVNASNKNSSNGLTLNKVGVWNVNANTFFNLSAGLNNTVNAVKIDISNNLLYLGGSFTRSNTGTLMAYAGMFDISSNSYSSLNNNSYVFDSSVNTIQFDSSNNLVYFGGNFNTFTLSLNRVGYVNLNSNTNIFYTLNTGNYNGLDSSVNALEFDNSNNLLYVGGSFKYSSSGTTLNNIGFWNANSRTFNPILTGVNGIVKTMKVDLSSNLLYFGGSFTKSTSGTLMNNAGIWNISTSIYSSVSNSSFDSAVNSILYDSVNKNVYFAGNFSYVYKPLNYLAYWSTSNNVSKTANSNFIFPLQNGVDLSVNSISLDSSNNVLYLGGTFAKGLNLNGTSVSMNRIGYFNITQGSFNSFANGLNNGVDNKVNAVKIDISNNILYLGGTFNYGSTINGNSFGTGIMLSNAGLWNLNTKLFMPLNFYKFNNSISKITLDSSNNHVYLTGSFTSISKESFNTGFINRSTDYINGLQKKILGKNSSYN